MILKNYHFVILLSIQSIMGKNAFSLDYKTIKLILLYLNLNFDWFSYNLFCSIKITLFSSWK